MLKTSPLWVTCGECSDCKLHPNPDRQSGGANSVYPIVRVFEAWDKMPAFDREFFLETVNRNSGDDGGKDPFVRADIQRQRKLFLEQKNAGNAEQN